MGNLYEPWKLGNPNKSQTYILPMLGESSRNFLGEKFPVSQFVNCFIGDTEKPELNQHIFLLYRFSGRDSFIKFEDSLAQNEFYVDKYDPDHLHVMYIFDVPEWGVQDYNYYKEGKYSKFSKDYKEHIQFFFLMKQDHPVMQTLNKQEERYRALEKELDIRIPRDMEASSIIDPLREIYRPEYKVKKAIKPHNDETDAD